MTETLLKVEGLKTWFDTAAGPVRAVDGIDFEIRRGETFALLGESGCGKSMTALSLMRLVPEPAGRIVEGRILFNGDDLLQLPEVAMRDVRGKHFAMVFQEPMTSLNPVLTVGRQIQESVTRHTMLKGAAAHGRVLDLLNAVGIPDPARRAGEYPHQLSGGMKQRVMIAIALAGAPDLLIADEPTTALDVTIQAQVLELLRRLQDETGMAILLITHDLGVVSGMADNVAVMYAGHIVEQAPAREFFREPRHPYSRKLFDSLPGMAKRGRRLAVIPGSVPSLRQIFTACRFEPRCDMAWEACRTHAPRWTGFGSGQGVRCHLWDSAVAAKPVYPVAGIASDDAPSPEQASPSAATGSLLKIQDLEVHFPIQQGLFKRKVGAVRAVDGISLDIPAGRTLALVGESGCGKTTVGKGILRLVPPTGGVVEFNGIDLASVNGRTLRRYRRDLQIIFQDPYSSMNPRMKVAAIIEEGMLAQGIGATAEERQARIDQLLEQVGMPPEAKSRYPHEFSGGQRQRICIARALAVEPRLIVCDEPTSALDVSVQAQILNLLKDLQDKLGLTYLFITHDLAVVEYLAYEVAVMYLGRIVERGTVRQVMENPLHPYTRALLSAVPEIEPRTEQRVIRLEGELPSPVNPPSGCHFHPRCPEAMAKCREHYPDSRVVSAGHSTACFLYGDAEKVAVQSNTV